MELVTEGSAQRDIVDDVRFGPLKDVTSDSVGQRRVSRMTIGSQLERGVGRTRVWEMTRIVSVRRPYSLELTAFRLA